MDQEKYARAWLDGNTWDDVLVCPYCGDRTEDELSVILPAKGFEHDGDKAEVACSACSRSFEVTLSLTYAYRTRPLAHVEAKAQRKKRAAATEGYEKPGPDVITVGDLIGLRRM